MTSDARGPNADSTQLLLSPVLRKAMTDFAAGTLGGMAGKIVECVVMFALQSLTLCFEPVTDLIYALNLSQICRFLL